MRNYSIGEYVSIIDGLFKGISGILIGLERVEGHKNKYLFEIKVDTYNSIKIPSIYVSKSAK